MVSKIILTNQIASFLSVSIETNKVLIMNIINCERASAFAEISLLEHVLRAIFFGEQELCRLGNSPGKI